MLISVVLLAGAVSAAPLETRSESYRSLCQKGGYSYCQNIFGEAKASCNVYGTYGTEHGNCITAKAAELDQCIKQVDAAECWKYKNEPQTGYGGYQQPPRYEQPVEYKPTYTERKYEQPSYEQRPMYEQPGYENRNMYEQPSYEQHPMYEQPGYENRNMYEQPSYEQRPMYEQQPAQYQGQPKYEQRPMYEQPNYQQPSSLNYEPQPPYYAAPEGPMKSEPSPTTQVETTETILVGTPGLEAPADPTKPEIKPSAEPLNASKGPFNAELLQTPQATPPSGTKAEVCAGPHVSKLPAYQEVITKCYSVCCNEDRKEDWAKKCFGQCEMLNQAAFNRQQFNDQAAAAAPAGGKSALRALKAGEEGEGENAAVTTTVSGPPPQACGDTRPGSPPQEQCPASLECIPSNPQDVAAGGFCQPKSEPLIAVEGPFFGEPRPSEAGGERCGEFRPVGEQQPPCPQGFVCTLDNEMLPDAGGTCTPPLPQRCGEFRGEGDQQAPCSPGFTCILEDERLPDAGGFCIEQIGAPCGAFTTPPQQPCMIGLVCVETNPQLPDLGGTCQQPRQQIELQQGERCGSFSAPPPPPCATGLSCVIDNPQLPDAGGVCQPEREPVNPVNPVNRYGWEPEYLNNKDVYLSYLDGCKEVPNAEGKGVPILDQPQQFGTAIVELNPSTWKFDVIVHLSPQVKKVTKLHMHGPATETETGAVVFDLFKDLEEDFNKESPIKIREVMFTEEQQVWLAKGLIYFNVHTEQFPDGALRGQTKCASFPCSTPEPISTQELSYFQYETCNSQRTFFM